MVTPPPTPRRPDHDHQPSMRMRVAGSMLRHGHHPQAVARATKVPLALVELINEHLDTHPPPPKPAHHDKPRPKDDHDAAGADPPARAAALLYPQLNDPRPRRSRRRNRTVLVAALLAWIADLSLSATADLAHLPALGMASLILAPVFMIILCITVLSQPPPGPGPDRSGAHRRHDHTGNAAAPGHRAGIRARRSGRSASDGPG